MSLGTPLYEQRNCPPCLTAQLHTAESGSEPLAHFTPRPEVWNLLMIVYFGCIRGVDRPALSTKCHRPIMLGGPDAARVASLFMPLVSGSLRGRGLSGSGGSARGQAPGRHGLA